MPSSEDAGVLSGVPLSDLGGAVLPAGSRSLAALAVAELMLMACAHGEGVDIPAPLRHVRCVLPAPTCVRWGCPRDRRWAAAFRAPDCPLNGEVTSREEELVLLNRLRKSLT